MVAALFVFGSRACGLQLNLRLSAHLAMSEAVFAARVLPDAEIRLSDEHDDLRWVEPAVAHELVLWPAYHRAIDKLEWLVANPEKAAPYRLPDPT